MNIETSTAIYLGVALIGGYWAVGKMLMRQFEKRLDEKFTAQAGVLQAHLYEEKKTAAQLLQLERDFLNWKGELPLNYVRREDYIRGQTVIEAKLDAVYNKLEVVQLKGTPHG